MSETQSSACPHCSEIIAAGAALCRHCQRGIDPAQFNPCPFCYEMVRTQATICRFCKGNLTVPTQEKEDVSPEPETSRETGMPKFGLPQIGRFFKPGKDTNPTARPEAGAYGASVREQVLEVIVRQALAGAPWREICAGPMLVNNITPQEVEAEVKRRLSTEATNFIADTTTPESLDQGFEHGDQQLLRLLQIAGILSANAPHQRTAIAAELKEIVVQLRAVGKVVKEHCDNNQLANTILQNEVDSFGTKYDAILDLMNERDKLIEELKAKIKEASPDDAS